MGEHVLSGLAVLMVSLLGVVAYTTWQRQAQLDARLRQLERTETSQQTFKE